MNASRSSDLAARIRAAMTLPHADLMLLELVVKEIERLSTENGVLRAELAYYEDKATDDLTRS
jgi:hypothetical protein